MTVSQHATGHRKEYWFLIEKKLGNWWVAHCSSAWPDGVAMSSRMVEHFTGHCDRCTNATTGDLFLAEMCADSAGRMMIKRRNDSSYRIYFCSSFCMRYGSSVAVRDPKDRPRSGRYRVRLTKIGRV